MDGSDMQRIQSMFGVKPNNELDIKNYSVSQMGLSPGAENSYKRHGIPPSHPNNPASSLHYSQFMAPRSASRQPGSQNLSPGPSHSRSLSQPPFFALDSLPPLSPLPYHEPSSSSLSDPIMTDVSMEESVVNSHAPLLPSPVAEGLPPRRGRHRRSNSDNIPLGFSAMIQSSPQLIPIGSQRVVDQSVSGRESFVVDKPIQLVMKGELKRDWDGNNSIADGMGERKSEVEDVDDLFNAFMNFDNIDKMNSSGTEDKDLDSRASGSKTNGGESSDNEVESCINGYPTSSSFANEKRGGKRIASGDIAPTGRHQRSVSMDSFMENMNFDDESPKLPPLGPSASNSIDVSSTRFSVEIGNGNFNEAELRKIKESGKLTEIALSDPRRAKRILANRLSAARSKERKTQYTVDLEHKAQTLETENTTLSIEVTKLQREHAAHKSEHNELKFRLQAMEQQSKLNNALTEALTTEVQRLRLTVTELGGETYLANCMARQLSINQQIFQLQRHEPTQLNQYQLQQQQHLLQPRQPRDNELQPQQRNAEAADHKSAS